ncbi:MAG TPA: hypothetical protein VI815_04345 [Candidatus Nanoarchaeia archaeon]|nr:hypothetical protein [Candidatus Nanoarchaeia archaeon]
MRNKFIVMVKSGSLKRSIENFGANRYLVKTNLVDNQEVNKDVLFMLSKTLGLPEERVILVSGENSDNKIFQIV